MKWKYWSYCKRTVIAQFKWTWKSLIRKLNRSIDWWNKIDKGSLISNLLLIMLKINSFSIKIPTLKYRECMMKILLKKYYKFNLLYLNRKIIWNSIYSKIICYRKKLLNNIYSWNKFCRSLRMLNKKYLKLTKIN